MPIWKANRLIWSLKLVAGKDGIMGMKNPRNTLWQAFRDGARFKMDGSDRTVTMHSEAAGSISLPSRRIVVSDPFLDPCMDVTTVHELDAATSPG